MNINNNSHQLVDKKPIVIFFHSMDLVDVPYWMISEAIQDIFNSTYNAVSCSASLGKRAVQLMHNPFIFSQLRNLNLSISDISTGMILFQCYLKFKFSEDQQFTSQSIKETLINYIKEKCTFEWGLGWVKKASGSESEGHSLIVEDPSFQKVLALAANPLWGMLVKHIELGFHVAAPLEWQVCMHTLFKFINKVVRNQIDEKSITDLIDSIINVVLNYKPSDNLDFLLFLFPELVDVVKLILKYPENISLLIPLLLGSKPMTFLQNDSFSQLVQEKQLKKGSKDNLQHAFSARLNQESPLFVSQQTKEILPSSQFDRIENGRKKLEFIQQDLLKKNETLRIGIVLEYDQNQTTTTWIKKILTEKFEALDKEYGDLTQLEWNISLIDARVEGDQELVEEINRYLTQCSLRYKQITFRHITEHQITGKAKAVKLGLNEMCLRNDIIGFVDLSDKINILEIGQLIPSIYEEHSRGNEGVAIGSRRMAMSHVQNKAFTFLLRSSILNWIVRATFPLLYQITDTQTGFKFFSKNAWINIQRAGLSCNSLAFDIEILQQAGRLGYKIKQFPVDFCDNSLHREGEIEPEKIAEMMSDLLAIRSNCSDDPLDLIIDVEKKLPAQSFENINTETSRLNSLLGEGYLLAGGAEHIVFRLEDGSLVKIPHEHYDPHFFGLLKHVIFKNRKKMKRKDQDKKLISSDYIRAILDHPKLTQYISLLRKYKEFNIFVMKFIANIENKNYLSLGYEISQKLGRDLIIPFCFVQEPFSLKLDGQWRSFSSSDCIKRSVSAQGIVKDQMIQILAENSIPNKKKQAKILSLIDDATDLLYLLWRRGIFDLDANIMSDMGYYPDTQGKLRLMVLDPGEMLDDLSTINTSLVRRQITERYDFKELKILLKQLGEDGDAILEQYQSRMMRFLDFIEEDLKKQKNLQSFGEDQRNAERDFSLIMPLLAPLPLVQSSLVQQNNTIEFYNRSKKGFHIPYNRRIPPIQANKQPSYPFLCCVPSDILTNPRSNKETVILTERGSIGPTLQALDQHNPDWLNPKTPSTLVLLDAGSAIRSSLLKYATERRTKGDLLLEGRPIYEQIAAGFSELLSSYLPEGYLVMASSDDLIQLAETDCQVFYNYFYPTHRQKAPGFFWSEIPNYQEKYLPHTITDTIQMIHDPAIIKLSETILKQIPIFKGVVQAGQIRPILECVSRAFEKHASFIFQKLPQMIPKATSQKSQILGSVANLYQQLLQYQAAERLNGLKTPFFMIFKKEFLADFKKNILPLISPSIYHDITWESILVRGIKMDKIIWMHSGKPSVISSKEWENLWEAIQELKIRHHIEVNCPVQGFSRSIKLEWQNFDDPYSLFMFAQSTYQAKKEQVWSLNKVEIISDQCRSQHPGNIESNLQGKVVVLNSKIEGKVVIEPKQTKSSRNKHLISLFYNVHLPAGSILHVPPSHLVVGIKGKIFSTKMGMISKEKLKTTPVYVYNQNGQPSFFSKYGDFQL